MRFWLNMAWLAVLLSLGLPLALPAAVGPDDFAQIRVKYRPPAAIPFPDSNPYSETKYALGQMLFFDPLLSRSRTRSCATCHNPSLSWGDGLPHAIGEDPKGLPLRAPTLIDVAFTEPLGWDGKFKISNPLRLVPLPTQPT